MVLGAAAVLGAFGMCGTTSQIGFFVGGSIHTVQRSGAELWIPSTSRKHALVCQVRAVDCANIDCVSFLWGASCICTLSDNGKKS